MDMQDVADMDWAGMHRTLETKYEPAFHAAYASLGS